MSPASAVASPTRRPIVGYAGETRDPATRCSASPDARGLRRPERDGAGRDHESRVVDEHGVGQPVDGFELRRRRSRASAASPRRRRAARPAPRGRASASAPVSYCATTSAPPTRGRRTATRLRSATEDRLRTCARSCAQPARSPQRESRPRSRAAQIARGAPHETLADPAGCEARRARRRGGGGPLEHHPGQRVLRRVPPWSSPPDDLRLRRPTDILMLVGASLLLTGIGVFYRCQGTVPPATTTSTGRLRSASPRLVRRQPPTHSSSGGRCSSFCFPSSAAGADGSSSTTCSAHGVHARWSGCSSRGPLRRRMDRHAAVDAHGDAAAGRRRRSAGPRRRDHRHRVAARHAPAALDRPNPRPARSTREPSSSTSPSRSVASRPIVVRHRRSGDRPPHPRYAVGPPDRRPGGRGTRRHRGRRSTAIDRAAAPGGRTIALRRTSPTTAGGLLVKVYGRDAWDDQFLGSLWTSLNRSAASSSSCSAGAGSGWSTRQSSACSPSEPACPSSGRRGGYQRRRRRAHRHRGSAAQPHASSTTSPTTSSPRPGRRSQQLHGAGDRAPRRRAPRPSSAARTVGVLLRLRGRPHRGRRQTSLMIDRVRLLVATALSVGHDRAVAAAKVALGSEGIAEMLPYLQSAVLDRAAAQVGENERVGPRRPARRRRSRPRASSRRRCSARPASDHPPKSLGTDRSSGCSPTSSSACWPASTRRASAGACRMRTRWCCSSRSLMSPFVQAAFAFSTIGATMARLRYVPVLMLQYAIQFIALTLALDGRPSRAGGALLPALRRAAGTGGLDRHDRQLQRLRRAGRPARRDPRCPGSPASPRRSAGSSIEHRSYEQHLVVVLSLLGLAIVLVVVAAVWSRPCSSRSCAAAMQGPDPADPRDARASRSTPRGRPRVLRHPAKVAHDAVGQLQPLR